MMFVTSVKTFFRRKSARRPGSSHGSRRLRHEPLEQRQLLSVTPAISIDDVTVDVQEGSMEFIDAFVSAESRLDNPRDVVIGPDGYLYVASLLTDSVLRYDGTTGDLVDEFIAPGSGGLDSPQSLAFDSDGDLYVCSYATDSVIRYDGTTGTLIDEFIASGSGGLDGPMDIVFGSDGALYVSSYLGDSVLRYDATTGGFVDEFVNSSGGGLDSPQGIAFDSSGNLCVSSYTSDSVLRYDGETGALIDEFVAAGSGGLNGPRDLVFHTDGMLYVNNYVGDSVLRFDGTTGDFVDEFVASGSGGLNAPCGIIFDDGGLLVGSLLSDSLLRYDSETGAFLDVFVENVTETSLDAPQGMTFGPDGNLYAISAGYDSVLRYDGTTGTLQPFIASGAGGLTTPKYLSFDALGRAYVDNDTTVLRYNPDGSFSDTFLDLGESSVLGVAFGPDGLLYVGQLNPGTTSYASDDVYSVASYDVGTGVQIDIQVLDAIITDLAFGSGGQLYVAARAGIYRQDSTTGTFEKLVARGYAGLDNPEFLVIGPDGSVFVSELFDTVWHFDGETGEFLEKVGDASDSRLDSVTGMAVDSSGHLYVASNLRDKILRYGYAGEAAMTVSLSQPVNEMVTVDFSTANGTAIAGEDYVGISGTLQFPPGVTSRTVLLETADDAVATPSETVFMNLSNASANAVIGDAVGQATILAQETPRISISDATVNEGHDLVFTVSLSPQAATTVTVDYSTSDITATAGEDYTSVTGSLTFAPGETEKVIVVATIDDSIGERDEQLVVSLLDPTTGTVITDNQGVGTLLVSDFIEVSIDDAQVTEDDQQVTFLGEFVASGVGGIDGPDSMEIGPEGDLYVGCLGAFGIGGVLRYDGITGEFIEELDPMHFGGLCNPYDIAFDSNGDLFACSSESVYRYDAEAGEFVEFVAADSGGLDWATALVFGPDGNLYVANFLEDAVLRYDGATGAFIDEFIPSGSGGLNSPGSMTFGSDGGLFVGCYPDSVLRYDGTTGAFIGTFVEPGSGGLYDANDLVFGADGYLYVASDGTDSVLRYDGETGEFVDEFFSSGSGALTGPEGLAFGGDGNLLVCDYAGDQVLRYGLASQALLTVSLSQPCDQPITVDYATSDVTAIAGLDYSGASGTLTFAPGVVTQTILVPALGDSETDPDETFVVSLSNPSPAAVIADSQAEVTILERFQPVTLFSDSFETGQWGGKWVEDSQNDWFTSTQRATEGSYAAEVDGRATDATLTLSSPVDLTPYGSAQLTFDWFIESGLDTGEYLALDLFDGTSWQEVARLSGNVDAENTWHHEALTIDGDWLVDNFQFRYRAKMSGSDEDANVDNVQLIATSLAAPPSDPPVAEAGGPYSVDEGGCVLLDGSESADPDGTIVAWDWDLDGDGAYETSGATVAFDAGVFGTYTVGLRVTDDSGAIDTDTATVAVTNLAPTADAGGAYSGNEGTPIQLDGTASTDPGNDSLTYAWDLDNNGTYETSVATPVFTAGDEGSYTVGLQVTDSGGLVDTDSATITVANVAPTADAGGPYSAEQGGTVTLDASDSSDPGDDTLSFAWDLDDDGAFDDATGATVVLSNLSNGTYAVAVQVSDGDGGVATDSTTVTVASETTLFSDSFESGQWNGLWLEDSQNDWFTSAQRATDGSYSAEVDGYAGNATLTLATPLDLTPYGTTTLTFDWLIENGFDAGEYLALDVYDGSWHELARLRGNVDLENSWYHETIDLTPYASEDFQFRFRCYVSRYNEDANVDNVQIVAGGAVTDAALLALSPSSTTKTDASDQVLAPVAVDLALMTME